MSSLLRLVFGSHGQRDVFFSVLILFRAAPRTEKVASHRTVPFQQRRGIRRCPSHTSCGAKHLGDERHTQTNEETQRNEGNKKKTSWRRASEMIRESTHVTRGLIDAKRFVFFNGGKEGDNEKSEERVIVLQ